MRTSKPRIECRPGHPPTNAPTSQSSERSACNERQPLKQKPRSRFPGAGRFVSRAYSSSSSRRPIQSQGAESSSCSRLSTKNGNHRLRTSLLVDVLSPREARGATTRVLTTPRTRPFAQTGAKPQSNTGASLGELTRPPSPSPQPRPQPFQPAQRPHRFPQLHKS